MVYAPVRDGTGLGPRLSENVYTNREQPVSIREKTTGTASTAAAEEYSHPHDPLHIDRRL